MTRPDLITAWTLSVLALTATLAIPWAYLSDRPRVGAFAVGFLVAVAASAWSFTSPHRTRKTRTFAEKFHSMFE